MKARMMNTPDGSTTEVRASARPKAIDFKKYRSSEIAESVTEIVDVKGKFLVGFKTMLLAFFAFLLLAAMLFWNQEKFTKFTIAMGYSGVAGIVFSLVMAIAGVVKRSLSEMEQLVGLLFSTTNQVAQDVTALGKGDTELPSARELVEGVYGDVLLPAVEQVVSTSLGWFGKPLLFAYRVTLGRVVRVAIELVPDSALAENEEALAAKADSVLGELSSINNEKSNIVSSLTWAQDHLGNLGAKAKFLVLLPCYAIATVVVSVILVPLVVLYFWG